MDDRLLSSVRDGAIDFDELLAAVRDLVDHAEGREALYDGGRGQMLVRLRSDTADADDLAAAKGTFQRISSYARAIAPVGEVDPLHVLAIRMEVLAHAISDHGAASDAYRAENLRQQPHVEACLVHLHHAGGKLARSELIARLGLKQANGTRVLKLLETARLVVRRKAGATVEVSFTTLGRKTAMAWLSSASRELTHDSSVIKLREGPVRGMSNTRWSLSVGALASTGS